MSGNPFDEQYSDHPHYHDHVPSTVEHQGSSTAPTGLALATHSPSGPKIFNVPAQPSPRLTADAGFPQGPEPYSPYDANSPASPPATQPTSPSYGSYGSYGSEGINQRSSYRQPFTPSPREGSPNLSPVPDDGPLSLASHYLPGKIGRMHRLGSRRHRGQSPYVDQQHRGSNYEPLVEGDESDFTPGTPGTPGTPTHPRNSHFAAGAFRRGDPSRWSSLSSTIAQQKQTPKPTLEQLAAEERDFDPDAPPELPTLGGHRESSTSSLRQSFRQSVRPPSQPRLSALNALPKQGGGREAWGPDGGGHATLGAGGFEDDDGVNVGFASGSNLPVNMRRTETPSLRQRPVFSVTAKEVLDTYKDDPDTEEKPNFVRRIFGGWLIRGSDGKHKRHLRWNKFKWALIVANGLLTAIAIGGLVGTILTWTNVWDRSDIVRVVNRTELILGTTAASLMLVTAILGWLGIFLNNRAFLAVWTLLLWIDFAFMVAPGYIAYKKHTFNLEGKMNETWSRSLGVDHRRMVQNTLTCCGWFNPGIEASQSSLCYARSALPGCKGRMTRFERMALRYIYTCAFSLVGPHLVLIVVALLSSNHVTYRFGKGLTPTAYRLNATTVARIQDDFLRKLTDMYGPSIVPAVLAAQKRLQQDRQSLLDDNRSDQRLMRPSDPSVSETNHSSRSHHLSGEGPDAYLASPSGTSHSHSNSGVPLAPIDADGGDPDAYAHATGGLNAFEAYDYPAFNNNTQGPTSSNAGVYTNDAFSREHLMASRS